MTIFLSQTKKTMRKVSFYLLTLALVACNSTSSKYGLGGKNAVQFIKEQASGAAQNTESIEVTGEDSLLCDIGLMFGVNDVYKALKKYNNGEISLKEARAVRDSVMHDGADVEDTWKFGSIVTDSLRHLSRIRFGSITSISSPISWNMPMRLPMNSV